ncbi:MAG: EcsC family protein [Thiogranum sp.]|nr:EcsC family protein [Thiogranum sp.]
MALSSAELQDLMLARSCLENPSMAARISNIVGSPIEKGFEMLPEKWHQVVNDATRKSIETGLDVALWTLDQNRPETPSSNWWHKLAVGTSGAAGGAFGLAALAIELPVSTTIMLRSIADIARSEGENLATPEAKLQCMQVLALGGRATNDDAAETGYFAARAAMARAVSDAAAHLAKKGLADKGAPALIRLIAQIASRFSIVVSEKAAAQAVPVVGAFGGAFINTLFIDHFQDVGKGHFIIRRLERLHGPEEIRRAYLQL